MMYSMSDNPFVECTARDMEYQDVVNYWCQPYDYYVGLDENALLRSVTPVFIEGARGSGKTMILKHLSYFCQRSEQMSLEGKALLLKFKETGSIGIYYRFKNDFGKLIAALNSNEGTRKAIFEEYYQLYYARELVLVIQDLTLSKAIDADTTTHLVDMLNDSFGAKSEDLADIILHINSRIDKIDSLIRKLKYLGNISESVAAVVSGEKYIDQIVGAIRENIPEWNNIKILVLIDEYENINAFHRVVNTYIKQTDAAMGITYRVGMRPEAVSTYATDVGTEHLQIGRDYLTMHLRVTDAKSFQRFLKAVAEKRLLRSPFFSANKLTQIDKILGMREDWIGEAREAVKNRPDIIIDSVSAEVLQKYTRERVKELVACPANPLLEMLNVLWLNRGKTPEETNEAMRCYLDAKENKTLPQLTEGGKKYYLDFEMKYKYSLLFVLLAKCGVKKKYYSFTTFSYLASGSVNDFLSLCRNTFMALDQKNYDLLLRGKPISAEIQSRGAMESASEHLDKIRLCEDSGSEMYTFVMNMGNVFRHYHRDPAIQFPETNQFAFENEAEVNGRHLLKRDLNYMLKWGVIEKKHNAQGISIGRRKGNLYRLNRMLAPIFSISYRTRGGYNFVVKTDVFEQMLSNSMDASAIISQNKRKTVTDQPKKEIAKQPSIEGQMSFFGGE